MPMSVGEAVDLVDDLTFGKLTSDLAGGAREQCFVTESEEEPERKERDYSAPSRRRGDER